MKKTLLKVVAVSTLIVSATAGSRFSAFALSTPEPRIVDSQTSENPDCLAAFTSANLDPGNSCITTSVLSATSPQPTTVSELRSAGIMDSGAATFDVVLALTTIKSKSYSQNVNSVTDSVTQYGKFYYDGTRAWVGTTYSGYKGTHFCKVDWAVGFSIERIACNESGGIAYRNLHMQWHYSALVSGFPVQWDEIHTVTVNKYGAITQ